MYLGCYDVYKENNTLWFSAIEHNGLYKYDLIDKETREIGEFKNEKDIPDLHRKVIRYGKELYFIPYQGNGISSIHLVEQYMKYYTLENKEEIHAADAFLFNDLIIILPRSFSQPLYIFDLKSKTFTSKKEWNNKIIKSLFISENHLLSLTSTSIEGQDMWTAITGTPFIIKTNLFTNEIKYYYLGDGIKLRSLSYGCGQFWCTLLNKGAILNFDFLKKTPKIISIDLSKGASFMNIIIQENYILILPCEGTAVYMMDLKGSCVRIIDKKIFPKEITRRIALYVSWIKDKEDIIILPCLAKNIIKMSEVKTRKVAFHEDMITHTGLVFRENQDNKLEDFLQGSNNIENLTLKKEKEWDKGSKIWNYIKESLL